MAALLDFGSRKTFAAADAAVLLVTSLFERLVIAGPFKTGIRSNHLTLFFGCDSLSVSLKIQLTKTCITCNTCFSQVIQFCQKLREGGQMSLKDLGPMVLKKRGSMGVRAAAAEIGIGSATLSRIERGKLPDVETLGKICDWLDVDPAHFIGSKKPMQDQGSVKVQVAFKKETAISHETSVALGRLIQAANEQFLQNESESAGHR